MLAVLLVSVAVSVHCQTQPHARPVISEVFEAQVEFFVRYNHSEEYRGEGVHSADQRKGLNLEIYRFEVKSHLETYRLQRYDLEKQYELSSDNRTCQKSDLKGDMPANWAWVKEATFVGTRNERQEVLDIWSYTVGFSDVEVAVNSKNPNVPVWVRRNSTLTDVTIFYRSFASQPNASRFEVPKVCGTAVVPRVSNLTTACRSRADMLAVAKAWVAAKVPYNQGALHDGYREDCSGYVSACWAEAKPGLTTSTFHTVGHFITKAELVAGDALLYAAEHIVLFEGWTDSTKTHYTAYEETKPGEGTVTRATPYPYWYSTSSFLPFRANSAC